YRTSLRQIVRGIHANRGVRAAGADANVDRHSKRARRVRRRTVRLRQPPESFFHLRSHRRVIGLLQRTRPAAMTQEFTIAREAVAAVLPDVAPSRLGPPPGPP